MFPYLVDLRVESLPILEYVPVFPLQQNHVLEFDPVDFGHLSK